jgi:hypothetical protein
MKEPADLLQQKQQQQQSQQAGGASKKSETPDRPWKEAPLTC